MSSHFAVVGFCNNSKLQKLKITSDKIQHIDLSAKQ